jgi:hypothetical protein
LEGTASFFGGFVLGWFFVFGFGFCLGYGWIRLLEAGQVFLGCDLPLLCWVFDMPLTGGVEFRAVLQKGNRVQVPKLVRWEFKMEPGQVLKIEVARAGSYGGGEHFLVE